jgi:hypothetical protein
MHILLIQPIYNTMLRQKVYTEMGGVERREQWKGARCNPPRRRIKDISYAPCVGKKCVIHAAQDTAALNTI